MGVHGQLAAQLLEGSAAAAEPVAAEPAAAAEPTPAEPEATAEAEEAPATEPAADTAEAE